MSLKIIGELCSAATCQKITSARLLAASGGIFDHSYNTVKILADNQNCLDEKTLEVVFLDVISMEALSALSSRKTGMCTATCSSPARQQKFLRTWAKAASNRLGVSPALVGHKRCTCDSFKTRVSWKACSE